MIDTAVTTSRSADPFAEPFADLFADDAALPAHDFLKLMNARDMAISHAPGSALIPYVRADK